MWKRSLYFGRNIFRNYKASFLLIFCVLFVETLVSLAIPYVIGKQSGQLASAEFVKITDLGGYLILWCVLFAIQCLMKFISTYRLNVLGAKLVANLSCRLYDHIQILPLRYFQDVKKGDVLSLLTHDLGTVSYYVTSVLTTLVPNLMVLFGSVIMMYWIEPLVALMIVTLIPIVYLVTKIIGRQIHPLSRQIVEKQADTLAIASENISTISLIKSFNRERTESTRYASRTGEVLSLRTRQFRYQALLTPTIQFLASVCIMAIIGVCLIQFKAGKIEIADIVSLLLYGMIFTRPVSTLAGLYGQTMQMTGALTRLLAIHGKEREPSDSGEKSLEAGAGYVEFDNVTFSYISDEPVLKGVCFTVEPQQTVLIVGRNGAGKSTLLHLLMRFHEPQSGRILIDGQDIRGVTTSSVRSAIGHVSQDVVLCNGSILDNITYGVEEANKDEVQKVCEQAGLVPVLARLPNGLHTMVGEGGVRLSGGQKQRIALARALLKKPAILLFDEPTSMLDETGRQQFRKELETVFKTFTIIMISHDPTLSDVADRVFTLHDYQLKSEQGKT